MNTAPKTRPSLDGRRFDVTVIGGGINGVAIARECARGGRSTLLLEQHDFGSGTTSRSTRIIHGGLRYLEHGEIGLVRESLRERERLLRERPHLVHPINFLLALGPQSQRSALEVRIGLWLYRRLAGNGSGRIRRGQDAAELERMLDRGSRWTVLGYQDAQCEFPERLVAEWLVEATGAGAVARNHTEVLQIDIRDGRVRSLRLRDRLTGEETRVETEWIINATGPWADNICEIAGIRAPRMIGGLRGSHIVLPKPATLPDAAVYTEALDGRPIFVIPWNGQLLVGTTEVHQEGDPGAVEPTSEEVSYLLQSIRDKFPAAGFSADQIRYAYAGVRPLPFTESEAPSAITRRHFLRDHADDGAAQLISVIGGKLTTGGNLGRQVARRLGIAVEEPRGFEVVTDAAEIQATLAESSKQLAASSGLPLRAAAAITAWHGPYATEIGSLAAQADALRQPLCPHSPHVVAEAVHAFEREHAMTLADVLLRRVPVALGACWSENCAELAAGRIGVAMGWDQRRIAVEQESFLAEWEQFLRRVPVTSDISAARR